MRMRDETTGHRRTGPGLAGRGALQRHPVADLPPLRQHHGRRLVQGLAAIPVVSALLSLALAAGAAASAAPVTVPPPHGAGVATAAVAPDAGQARRTRSSAADSGCAGGQAVGHSRDGDVIRACPIPEAEPTPQPEAGPPSPGGRESAQTTLLVVGSMHGDERAGTEVTRFLQQHHAPAATAVWTIATVNPDGARRGTRGNARGVDLNGNFPTPGWHVRFPGTEMWGGPRAASEPETRALMRAVRMLRPDVVVVFHQAGNGVDCAPHRPRRVTRLLSALTGYPVRCLPVLTGNFTDWANRSFPATTAVTFELNAAPSGRRLHTVARGLLRLAAVWRDSVAEPLRDRRPHTASGQWSRQVGERADG